MCYTAIVYSCRIKLFIDYLFESPEVSKLPGLCLDMIIDPNTFYRSKRWEKLRASVLRRDGYMCQECRRYGRMRQAQTVHHIKHLDEYPELAYDPKNLKSVCAACHNKLHPEKGIKSIVARKNMKA